MSEIIRNLENAQKLDDLYSSIGAMLWQIGTRFADKAVFGEKLASVPVISHSERSAKPTKPTYHYVNWGQFLKDMARIAAFIRMKNILPGERIAVVAGNHYQRFVTEMSILASGRVCVPIFAGYGNDLLEKLIEFSQISALFIDSTPKFAALSSSALPATRVLFTRPGERQECCVDGSICFSEMINQNDSAENEALLRKEIAEVQPDNLSFVMYTSGTSSFPKGVMLTHGNILSQQMALRSLWKPQENMRFLCYLPWHHSFGGLFERFFALSTGGSIAIDDSMGKDVDQLLENFALVKPQVYFSVPKIYQEIVSKIIGSPEVENIFFHPELKFVFTAAAALPLNISHVFKNKNIPVIEGWGLTETSPCCTLTDFSLDRKQGVVGKPIPGVALKIADDGEILVRGPNVMTGYFHNKEATEAAFDGEGFFKTGDIGEITEDGLKIMSRKDRVFKLSNGEKVYPSVIEEAMRKKCKLIKFAFVFGAGESSLFALLFPNFEYFKVQDINRDLGDPNCDYPRSLELLCGCLRGCISIINQQSTIRYEKVKKAVIINRELSLEEHEITPSFKLVPRTIEEKYRSYMDALLRGTEKDLPKDCWLVAVD